MVDVKDKDRLNSTPVRTQAVAQEQNNADQKKPGAVAASPDSFTAKHKMSKGEKIFNWATYRGLNFWVNLISSVAVADYFINRGGQGWLGRRAQDTARFFPKGKSGNDAIVNSMTTWKTATLTSGGWALLIPLKLLEDRKRSIVHWLNKKLGVDQTAADGKELTSDQIYIEQEQPTMPWWKVVARRTVAFLAVLGSGALINYAFRDQKKTDLYTTPEEKIHDAAGGKSRVTDFAMEGINKIFNSKFFPRGSWLANNTRAQSWIGFAVLDSLFTEITAVVMWVTRGAKKKQLPNEVPLCPPATNNAVEPTVADGDRLTDRENLKARKAVPMGSYTEAALQKPTDVALAP